MKITSIKWTGFGENFAFVVSNEDTARQDLNKLNKSNNKGLFNIQQFNADTLEEVVRYITSETLQSL